MKPDFRCERMFFGVSLGESTYVIFKFIEHAYILLNKNLSKNVETKTKKEVKKTKLYQIICQRHLRSKENN